MGITVGVLALQGDFREHLAMIEQVGGVDGAISGLEVRSTGQLDEIDALIIPGGESTAISRLAASCGLVEPLKERIHDGMPVLGTCAGMIVLASSSTGPDQLHLGVLDAVVERNAFGRQVDSFEADLAVAGWDSLVHAVFIRAPWIHSLGRTPEVLATVDDPLTGENRVVFVRQGNLIATSFHPELIGDTRVHEMLVELVGEC